MRWARTYWLAASALLLWTARVANVNSLADVPTLRFARNTRLHERLACHVRTFQPPSKSLLSPLDYFASDIRLLTNTRLAPQMSSRLWQTCGQWRNTKQLTPWGQLTRRHYQPYRTTFLPLVSVSPTLSRGPFFEPYPALNCAASSIARELCQPPLSFDCPDQQVGTLGTYWLKVAPQRR